MLIEHVTLNGKSIAASKLLANKDSRDIVLMRMNDSSEYKCCECGQKVKIRNGGKRSACFYHPAGSQYCILQPEESSHKSSIYIGEQRHHADAKNTIAGFFINMGHDVVTESTVKGGGEWRRPDIFIESLNMAIEVQRAWIGVDELKARTEFYKKNNFKLIWIFIHKNEQSQFMADVLYGLSSHEQIFIFNKEQLTICKSENRFELICEYTLINNQTSKRIVPFHELHLDEAMPYVRNKDSRADTLTALLNVAKSTPKMAAFCDGVHRQIIDWTNKSKVAGSESHFSSPLSSKQRKAVTKVLKRNGFPHIDICDKGIKL